MHAAPRILSCFVSVHCHPTSLQLLLEEEVMMTAVSPWLPEEGMTKARRQHQFFEVFHIEI